MTAVTPSFTALPSPGDAQGYLVTWANLANGDTGVPTDLQGFADRSVQVEGTFGAGGICQIQGSNDGVNFRPLHDPQGNVLNISAAGMTQVTEIPRLIQPSIIGGDGTTSLTISIFKRKTVR